MKLYINEKNSWTKEKLEVLNEEGQIRFTAEGELFKGKHVMSIYDTEEKEIGIIKKNAVGLLSSFDVEVYDEFFGTIEPTMNVFKTKFDVDLFGWKVISNWWGNKYSIYKDNNLIASFEFILNGSNANYEVNISNPEDEMPMILLVLTLYIVRAHMLTKVAVYH